MAKYNSKESEAINQLKSTELKNARSTFYELAENILHVANNVMAKDQEAAHHTIVFVTKMFIIATAVSIILGIIISLFISRSISKAVTKVSNVMGELAKGNFSVEPLKVKTNDEIGDLISSMNQMIQHLKNMLGQVSTSSEQIDLLTDEIVYFSEQSTIAADQLAAIS